MHRTSTLGPHPTGGYATFVCDVTQRLTLLWRNDSITDGVCSQVVFAIGIVEQLCHFVLQRSDCTCWCVHVCIICLCICMHLRICMHYMFRAAAFRLHVLVYICVHYMFIHAGICMHASMHVCMYTCMYVCMHLCVHMFNYMYVCMCVCVCIYIYVYTHTHMYTCIH